ncbi:MAG: NUDIX domain-containing protein [Gammaproteobacteria bacterium]|nr:NUDIX domain-containing protein [Gammaproteobacteria bacterium]NNF48507.1 NUDIX domain-containing protein [Woeseiaceae bacterium]MBT8094901.1 NUDIX domain-containing protein [Gammaproteobacteria bacterium]MBT8106317.1 NUDIX domain-containing protein [Gammaproteobacteria bacterium]NNK26331.1 NUDIX domain-containing protein [Woeseiaceae bacterium]
MHPTDLTVAAVVEHNDEYLLIEEQAMGRRVITQPGGHIESGESPEQAVVREVLEESGCAVECRDMVGVYLWIHPQSRQQFLRIVYAADFISCDESAMLDTGVFGRLWLSIEELHRRQANLRTPGVLRCVEDYRAGRRAFDTSIMDPGPRHPDVQRILAAAEVV